jgi:cytochrome c-type biogenesis protein
MIADIGARITEWWGPGLAFAAGVVSFASPCVLPVVPGYLAFVTGGESAPDEERKPLIPILLFVLGFAIVFTVVGGFTASALASWLRSDTGERVAGGFVLSFGIFMLLYALRLGAPWLYREQRPFLARVRPGRAGALPLGMAFAVGWTPCIGPVLGAILTLAARVPGNETNPARSVLLLFFYSIGLGLPFLFVGLGVRWLLGAFRFFTRNYHWFAGASGAVMGAIGILLLTGQWTRVMAPLLERVVRFTPAL